MDPLYLFVFLGLFTPGPNVILITTSGARFGLRATLPHIAGIVLGVGITAGLTGLGIGALLAEWPWLKTGLSVLAAAWILWMAVQLWRATPAAGVTAEDARGALPGSVVPMGEPEALGDHAGGGIGLSGSGLSPWEEAQRLALAFSGLNLFVCFFWAFTGALISRLLTDAADVADLHPCHGHRVSRFLLSWFSSELGAI
jgi:threonine/homoserine/homoserine lactone efflux protein